MQHANLPVRRAAALASPVACSRWPPRGHLRLVAAAQTPHATGQSVEQLVQSGRRASEQKHIPEAFAIAGVTFAGRQEVVRTLQPNQILLLEREPWNPHDPDAVHVTDLLGRSLGFIPRRDSLNARFKHERFFALVASVGPAGDTNQLGARIYARPKVPSFILDPFPHAIADSARLTNPEALFGERWRILRSAALAAASYRCELTQLSQAQVPLQVVPSWRYNPSAKAVQLSRLVAMCQPLADAKGRLEQRVADLAGEGADTAAGALRELQCSPDGMMFTEINGLAEEDALQYFELVRRGTQTVLEQGWKAEVLL